ncbi:MAG TPA: ATP-dependent Clp protease proteolytic subunit [Polyangiaceae bacterium]|nr:ATP-dependent Clp protease proteolytic subunit [Polyangiaceae bacterium]
MPEAAPSPSQPSDSFPDRIQEALFFSRTVLLFGEIEQKLARTVTAQLLALAAANSEPIRLLVNSPGGHVESADTIHDVIRYVNADVTIVGTGWVASAAALVYIAVPRERRLALPNTRFLLHQPLGATQGPASDVEIEAAQILSIRSRLNRLFSEATGQPLEKVRADTDRNHWMTAEEAIAYGLVGALTTRAR